MCCGLLKTLWEQHCENEISCKVLNKNNTGTHTKHTNTDVHFQIRYLNAVLAKTSACSKRMSHVQLQWWNDNINFNLMLSYHPVNADTFPAATFVKTAKLQSMCRERQSVCQLNADKKNRIRDHAFEITMRLTLNTLERNACLALTISA